MRRADVPAGSGLRTVEGRLFGDSPWDNQIDYSFKWLSDSIMDRTIRNYVTENWNAIRIALASKGSYVETFPTPSAVGEGFYNTTPKSQTVTPFYFKTSLVRVVFRLNPNAPRGFTIHTTFPAATGGN